MNIFEHIILVLLGLLIFITIVVLITFLCWMDSILNVIFSSYEETTVTEDPEDFPPTYDEAINCKEAQPPTYSEALLLYANEKI